MADFYVLLALTRSELHAYAIKGAITNDSLGSMRVSDGNLSSILARLHDEGLIDMLERRPTGKSGVPRIHYGISEFGAVRLQEEFNRLDHALKIADSAGVREKQLPDDLTRVLLEMKASGRN